MTKIYMKTGDRLPVVRATVTTDTGEPIDISDASVVFVMYPVNGDTATIDDAQATISDPLEGTVRYDWRAGDTDKAGLYVAEFRIDFPDGNQMTAPSRGYIEVEIQESLS